MTWKTILSLVAGEREREIGSEFGQCALVVRSNIIYKKPRERVPVDSHNTARLGMRTHADRWKELPGQGVGRLHTRAICLRPGCGSALCGWDCLARGCLQIGCTDTVSLSPDAPTTARIPRGMSVTCALFSCCSAEGEGNVCLLPFVVFRWKLRLNLFGGTDRNQLASESSVWAHIYACHHLIEIGCDFERDY